MDFTGLTKREADDYLVSFIADIPGLIEWLRAEWAAAGRAPEQLDFSSESLTPLWRWAAGEVAPRDGQPAGDLPTWVDPRMGTMQFSDRALWVIDAVGRYLGEVFVRNAPGATWAVARARTKGYVDQNWPAVRGLGDFINPIQLVQVAATMVLHGDPPPPNRLQQLYETREQR